MTGQGLSETLSGAKVAVDVTDSRSSENAEVINFFETSSRDLLAAGQVAGVRHHVALSIVGTERLFASGYFRAKLAQEKRIKAALVAYTIVRATQFFEFVGDIADANTEGDRVRVSPALVQPIAAEDVAESLAEIATQVATNRVIEIAGPVLMGLDKFVGQYLRATKDARRVTIDPDALYFGAALNDVSLTPGKNPRLGKIAFADWLGRPAQKR